MKFASNVCPKCDAEIFSDAAEGLCTACLLETGLGLFTEVDDSAQSERICARRRKCRPKEERGTR